MSIAITANAPEAHIQRTSRLAAAIVAFFIVATPLALAAYVASDALILHPWLTVMNIPSTALGPVARMAILAATFAAFAPWMWGLWELRRLFLGYANGAVFTQQAAVHFGNFARYMVENGHGRELSRQECRDVLLRCADEGMVHGVSNWLEPVDTI